MILSAVPVPLAKKTALVAYYGFVVKMALTKLTFPFGKALKFSRPQHFELLERNSWAKKLIEVFIFVISAVSQKFGLELSCRTRDQGQLERLSILGRRVEKKSRFPLLSRSAVIGNQISIMEPGRCAFTHMFGGER